MMKSIANRIRVLAQSMRSAEIDYTVNILNASKNSWADESVLVESFAQVVGNDDFVSTNKERDRKRLEFLESRMLDIMLSDHLLQLQEDNGSFLKHFIAQKNYLKAKLLSTKGLLKRAYFQSEKSLSDALLTENLDVAILNVKHQIRILEFSDYSPDLHSKFEQLQTLQYHRRVSEKALALYYELKLRNPADIEDLNEYFFNSIDYLTTAYRKSKLKTIQIILLYFKKKLYESQGKFYLAIEQIGQLYLHSNKDYASNVFSDFYEIPLEHACANLEIHQFEFSNFLLEKCTCNLPIESTAALKAFETYFLSLIYQENYQGALKIQNVFFLRISEQKENMNTSILSKWHLYKSCSLFYTNDFKNALKELGRSTFYKRQEPKFFIQGKILELICLIELKNLDQADKTLESIRKYVYRNNMESFTKQNGMTEFFRCIKLLSRSGYRPSFFNSNIEVISSLLYSIEEKISLLNIEDCIIRFDKWLANKVNKETVSLIEDRRIKMYDGRKVQRLLNF